MPVDSSLCYQFPRKGWRRRFRRIPQPYWRSASARLAPAFPEFAQDVCPGPAPRRAIRLIGIGAAVSRRPWRGAAGMAVRQEPSDNFASQHRLSRRRSCGAAIVCGCASHERRPCKGAFGRARAPRSPGGRRCSLGGFGFRIRAFGLAGFGVERLPVGRLRASRLYSFRLHLRRLHSRRAICRRRNESANEKGPA